MTEKNLQSWRRKKNISKETTVIEVEYNGMMSSVCLKNLIACIEFYTKQK